MFIYSFIHDRARDKNVNHLPVILTRPIDKSSSLLGIVISGNEKMDCILDFYRTNQSYG
ncbi:hypothetical protein KKI95_05505 [Xenorhabdus bovienii]|nr:hypothetical protein [Xenorhabdus bovienii]MDE9429437.1 hypothetical protein [Xenorhabdus bovienii]MDE9435405.1 hypothetical protein [Xenorhabdus bovienii]MDE9465945.1 hypothetical protein [Xenorhabdus bovienii]MDE9538061.1 hypothetical protein [Xenorhabdus bovienii]